MHKSILCALAIGALLVAESCTKEQRQPKSDVRTLTYAMSGNSMYTKAVQAEDVLQAINATLPTEMNLVRFPCRHECCSGRHRKVKQCHFKL